MQKLLTHLKNAYLLNMAFVAKRLRIIVRSSYKLAVDAAFHNQKLILAFSAYHGSFGRRLLRGFRVCEVKFLGKILFEPLVFE